MAAPRNAIRPAPMPTPRRFALLLLASALPAQAQVHRCRTAEGAQVYTDRPCAEIGATEHLPPVPVPIAPAPSTRPGGRPAAPACARNLQDLAFALRAAIEARDVNRLAGLYHWTGVSSRDAVDLMTRLDAVAQRPLVDVIPIPASSPAAATTADAEALARPAPVVALRVEQTLANGSTPSSTVFGLQRHLGCWWIRL